MLLRRWAAHLASAISNRACPSPSRTHYINYIYLLLLALMFLLPNQVGDYDAAFILWFNWGENIDIQRLNADLIRLKLASSPKLDINNCPKEVLHYSKLFDSINTANGLSITDRLKPWARNYWCNCWCSAALLCARYCRYIALANELLEWTSRRLVVVAVAVAVFPRKPFSFSPHIHLNTFEHSIDR